MSQRIRNPDELGTLEVSKLLGVNKGTFRGALSTGRLPKPAKRVGRRYVFTRAEVEALRKWIKD